MELEYYKTTYGIEVIKKQYIEEEPILEITKVQYNGSENNLDNILNVLKRNKVTPITLQDVMCDLEKVYN